MVSLGVSKFCRLLCQPLILHLDLKNSLSLLLINSVFLHCVRVLKVILSPIYEVISVI